ncbi:MAG: ferritin family protein [Tissierellaceae bacterium]|nr:ferritin family protein [Tissierellaceae bacterium]
MNYTMILKYAMQMELDGYNFFKENASKMSNPTSEAMFLELAEAEKQHYEYLENQLNYYLENNAFDTSPEAMDREEDVFANRAESEHIEETLEESMIPDLTILRMAYLIERDFKEFYTEASENAEDENIKAIFKKLANWEEGHERLFKNEYSKRMKEYMNLPWGG